MFGFRKLCVGERIRRVYLLKVCGKISNRKWTFELNSVFRLNVICCRTLVLDFPSLIACVVFLVVLILTNGQMNLRNLLYGRGAELEVRYSGLPMYVT